MILGGPKFKGMGGSRFILAPTSWHLEWKNKCVLLRTSFCRWILLAVPGPTFHFIPSGLWHCWALKLAIKATSDHFLCARLFGLALSICSQTFLSELVFLFWFFSSDATTTWFWECYLLMFGNVSAWSCLLSVVHGKIENLQLCFIF